MSIRNFRGLEPRIDPSAFVDPLALVIGDVVLEANVFVLPMVVIRGDVNSITIGPDSNIQDGSVLHVNSDSVLAPGGSPLSIGRRVTVGHKCLLHGCDIGDDCLIGMGATVMDRARVGDHVIIGAGSLVTPGKHLDSGFLYAGAPARQIRPLKDKELEYIEYSHKHYAELKDLHRNSLQ